MSALLLFNFILLRSTPAMTPVAQRAFVQHMEDFKTRISLLRYRTTDTDNVIINYLFVAQLIMEKEMLLKLQWFSQPHPHQY